MSALERMDRRTFLKTSAAASAAAGGVALLAPDAETAAQAPAATPETKIVKNVCHQCPARCGIDVHVTDGKVHNITGSLESPISNGKLCPKGPLGAYILYDPDRIKGPMKRTNPNKGRNENPKFAPITWDEALDTIAARLNALREKGEAHRFALAIGRGWGSSDAGLAGTFGRLLGTPNSGLGHSSMCADASKKAKLFLDGNYSYNSYDYANTNYILNFGASFLEAFRPYNHNMQTWGHIRTKAPKTKVTVVDVRLSTTGAAADRALLIKPGTDGALALAIAHVILTEGLWDRRFVGDFVDAVNRFKPGDAIDPASFKERWTKGLIEWWNEELKDRTPKWAAGITTIPEHHIVEVAREFGTTRPAMAFFERGPTTHTNGTYNGMCIHSLNALVGSMFAEGGLAYQMGVPYGKLPVDAAGFVDDLAKTAAEQKMPRIDRAKTKAWPMVDNMLQEIAKNHLKGDPYKLDTFMFYYTNPTWSGPEAKDWEAALKDVFVIETSPYPSETGWFADLLVPDHSYLERLQDAPTYPFQGWPMTAIRVPAVKPVHNTMNFGDVLIEIGKRIKGPMGEYYKKLGNTENVIRAVAKGFEQNPGDNGVNSFESWMEKGVWYKKPYLWRQVRGEFFEWDGSDWRKPMTEEDVKKRLFKTGSGKFELKSSALEKYADYISEKMGIPKERVGLPQWVEPKYHGGGDLFFVTPKTPMHAEGRSANIPHAVSLYQPIIGGKNVLYLEIHPETAKKRGIANGATVKISTIVGSITALARYYPATRPDTVVMAFGGGHWAGGRWSKAWRSSNPSEIIPNVSDPISGLTSNYSVQVKVEKA